VEVVSNGILDGMSVIVVLPDVEIGIPVVSLAVLIGWADVALAVVAFDAGVVPLVASGFSISCPRIKACFETHLLV
jgi:hypothetical protein